MSKKFVPESRLQVYDGLRFVKDKATGYYLCRKNQMRLHRYIWTKYNGEIPKGFSVHHKDFNKENNCIDNLVLIGKKEHTKLHCENYTNEYRKRLSQNMIKNCMPKAVEWHKSKEGRLWHSEHAKKIARYMPKILKVCQICGKVYTVKIAYDYKSRFCSNNCKATNRRRLKRLYENKIH